MIRIINEDIMELIMQILAVGTIAYIAVYYFIDYIIENVKEYDDEETNI